MGAASAIELVDSAHSGLLDPIEDRRWGEFVAGAPRASIFHHPSWLALLREQYGYRMLACCVIDPDGQVRAGLPLALVSSRLTGRRLVALPFSDVCTPLSEDGAERRLDDVLDELRLSLGVELRVHGPLARIGRPGAAYHHHLVRLEADVDAVRRRFTRRQALQGVRRAQGEGVGAEQRPGSEALAAFYRLPAATRRRQGIPTQPRRFILAFAQLFEQELGFVSLASVEGRAIAAAVFLVHTGGPPSKKGGPDPRF